MPNLIDYIRPGLMMPRSVNLERDATSLSLLDEYFLGQKSCEALQHLASAMDSDDAKAWSLVGPYGMGKSSFLNFLEALLGPADDLRTKRARTKLCAVHRELGEELITKIDEMTQGRGFALLAVTANYEPLARTIERAVRKFLEESEEPERREQDSHNCLLDASEDLLAAVEAIKERVKRPVALIIDEFGKNLEFLAHHPGQGDLFILQRLAETRGFYIWVSLHQNFEEYMYGLSVGQKKEWVKIQGRFEEIAFVESQELMLSLAKKALKQTADPAIRERIREWAAEAYDAFQRLKINNSSFELTVDAAADLYPIHPIALAALFELCRSYAQYDRTLISFLTGGDSLALPAFLSTASIDENHPLPTVGLEHLYDYFFRLSSKNMYIGRPEEQRLLEIDYRIRSGEYLGPLEKSILRSVGILNLVGGRIGFKATPETLQEIIAKPQGISEPEFAGVLRRLVANGFLLFREYAGEYVMWEGSDIDLSEEIRKVKPHLAVEELDSLLEKYVPLTPVIASRHSYEKGTVRRFERRWIAVEKIDEAVKPEKGFDGLLLYSFGYLEAAERLPARCADRRPLLIGHLNSWSVLKELVLELAAARYVEENNYQLANDGVARRELRYRIAAAEKALQDYIAQTFLLANKEVEWYAEGKKQNVSKWRDLSSLLSELCDRAYDKCPVIRNELINYNNLSAAAARARRDLVEAMATRSTEEELGFTGWKPERAIYRTLLRANGLHRYNPETNEWELTLDSSNPMIKEIWSAFDKCLEENQGAAVTAEQMLGKLLDPPFGMKEGPASIFLCHYLLCKSDEVAVFQEERYCTYLGAAEVSLLVKRPDLFCFKKVGETPLQRLVLERYRRIWREVAITDEDVRNRKLLSLVAPLIQFVQRLPYYTLYTRSVSPMARKVLLAISNSTDPDKLLLEDLPDAVEVELDRDGLSDEQLDELSRRLSAALHELKEAYPRFVGRVEKELAQAFDVRDISRLYAEIEPVAAELQYVCDDQELRAVLTAMAAPSNDVSQWAQRVASRLLRKPLERWNDKDIEVFREKARDCAERIEQLRILAAQNKRLQEGNACLLSLMLPGGYLKRILIKGGSSDVDEQTRQIIEEIKALPPEKSLAVLRELALELMGGREDEPAAEEERGKEGAPHPGIVRG